MKSVPLPRIGMRVVKTAVAVMLSYTIFVPFGLIYNEALGGVWGQLGPLYACIACIICTQSTLGQTIQQGLSRLIGVAVGGALGTATLLLGAALDDPWVRIPALGAVCVAGVWICLLLKRPTACGMACILPCVILITGVTGVTRYYYAAARIIETVVGLLIALGVNAALPDLRPEPKKEAPHMQVEVKNSTKKLCVIGEPVLHSKSPLIQNTMLAALGLEVVPGQANYLLFRAAGAADLNDRILTRGVLIRSCANYHGLGNDWYRVCVGQAEQNRRLLAALKEVL